jgi:hypothetical protein
LLKLAVFCAKGGGASLTQNPNTLQLSTRFAQKVRSLVKHEPHSRKVRRKAYKMRFCTADLMEKSPRTAGLNLGSKTSVF